MSEAVLTGEVLDEMPTDERTTEPDQNGSGDLVHVPQGQPLGLFGNLDPTTALQEVERHATALKKFVTEHDLALEMEDGEWVTLPGWEALGTWLGVFSVVDAASVEQIQGGWKAYARAITRAGEVVGGAVGICLRAEVGKQYAPESDICSMAQARARRNALRGALSIVVNAAGFDTQLPDEKPMTPRQRAKLFAMLKQYAKVDEKGRTDKQLKDWITDGTLRRYGKRISGLNRGEAKKVIDGVQAMLDMKMPKEETDGTVFEPSPQAEAEAERLDF